MIKNQLKRRIPHSIVIVNIANKQPLPIPGPSSDEGHCFSDAVRFFLPHFRTTAGSKSWRIKCPAIESITSISARHPPCFGLSNLQG